MVGWVVDASWVTGFLHHLRFAGSADPIMYPRLSSAPLPESPRHVSDGLAALTAAARMPWCQTMSPLAVLDADQVEFWPRMGVIDKFVPLTIGRRTSRLQIYVATLGSAHDARLAGKLALHAAVEEKVTVGIFSVSRCVTAWETPLLDDFGQGTIGLSAGTWRSSIF